MSQFQDFEAEYGPPANCEIPSAETVAKYEGRLPAELLEKWREVGFCSYGKGLLWLVDPAQFADIIDDWMEVSTDSEPVVFLRTAFAHLYFWQNGAVFSLDVQRGSLSEVTKRVERIFTLLCDPEVKEKMVRASLFEQALPLLGPPERDECYAFEPVLALGGPGTVDTLRRVKIREHLGILAEIFK
jgi:hypothetical protein